MPYSGISELPDYIRSKPEARQHQWMAVWNSSYSACMKGSGDQKACESEAFRKANGVIKGAEMADDMMTERWDLGDAPFALFVEAPTAFGDQADLEGLQWIPFLPKPGTFQHPRYGSITITPDFNQSLVDSVKNKVYQENIPLDAEHQTKLSGAVAWLKDMRMNDDGSADAAVEWTSRGQTMLKGGQFKYVSPEWFGTWTDPATGEVHQNVVAGGAITTRPFFKEKALRALVASETGNIVFASDPSPYWFRDFSPEQRDAMAKSGVAMPDGSYPIPDVDALSRAIQAYGRSPDQATKAHIKKRAAALGKTDMLPDNWSEEPVVDDKEKKSMGETDQDPKTYTATEVDDKLKEVREAVSAEFTEKLTTMSTELEAAKTLAATEKEARETQGKELMAIKAESRRRDFVELTKEWVGDADKNVAFLEKLADQFGQESETFTDYVEAQKGIAEQVKEANLFKEVGTSSSGSGSAASDPERKLEDLAKAYRKEHPELTFAQAYTEVISTPEGAQLYEKA